MTTNLPFEQWTEVLGSERLTGVVLDRLTHRCHILESTGESNLLQDARRRRTGSAPETGDLLRVTNRRIGRILAAVKTKKSFLLRKRKDSDWNAPAP